MKSIKQLYEEAPTMVAFTLVAIANGFSKEDVIKELGPGAASYYNGLSYFPKRLCKDSQDYIRENIIR